MKLRWWVVAIGYLGLAIIMTWPLSLNLSTHILGAGGDAPMFVWNAWWLKQVMFDGQSLFNTNYIFWPQTIGLYFHTLALVNSVVIALLSTVVNLVLAFNVWFLTSVALSGLFTFLLVKHLTKSDLSAFFSGIIFAFAPYLTMHWLGHYNLITVWFIPLFAWLIIRLKETYNFKFSIWAGIVAGLASLNDFYNPVFLFGFLLLFIIWLYVERKKENAKLIKHWLTLLSAWLAVWGIWWLPTLLSKQSQIETMTHEQITAFYGADMVRYLTPSFLNPFWGWLASMVPGRFSGGVEGTIFLGFTPLILVAIYLIYKFKNKIKETVFPSVWFWLILILGFGLLSFGPYLKIVERILYVPLPYAWVSYIVPIWDNLRVPARFSLMVIFGLAVLAGFALTYLFTKIKTPKNQRIIFWALSALIIMEFIPAPYPLMDLTIPPVYDQIRDDKTSESLLEIPWGVNSGYGTQGFFDAKFQYYATYHNKKIALGSISRVNEENIQFYPINQLPFSVDSSSVSNFGRDWQADWVVVHKKYLNPNDLITYQKYLTDLGYRKAFEDGLDVAYCNN